MKLNLKAVPFSRRRSYMAISDIPEQYRSAANEAGLHLRTVRGGAAGSVIAQIIPTMNGKDTEYSYEADASQILMHTAGGDIGITFADDRTILLGCRSANLGLHLHFVPAPPYWFDYLIKVPGEKRLRYMVNCFGQDVKYLLWAQTGECSLSQEWKGCTCDNPELYMRGRDEGFLFVIREVHSEWDGAEISYDYEAARRDCEEDYRSYARSFPSVPAELQETAEGAAYVDWASIVAADGFLPRDTMYMSKNWMTNIWAWDHVFNAMALSYGNPDAAWDQWMIPFDLQDPSGLIPDTTNNSWIDWNYCKPPVHGWALKRMREHMTLSPDQMTTAYNVLKRWTEWWINRRDRNRNGICEYDHGFDSGWDNATCFRVDPQVESPDLTAFLVVQMDELADLAKELGKWQDEQYWKAQSKKTMDAMLQHCFSDGKPVVKTAYSQQIVTGDCLLPNLSVLVADRMPEEYRKNIVDTLKSDTFLTEYGFATESPASPLYEADGYWRGPIWAPAMLIILDGLRACGEEDFAKDAAKRFCRLVREHGYAENFDAITGAGLRDLAYTWTPSTFFIAAHDYLMDENE